MSFDRLQKYRVTLVNGETFEGFAHVETFEGFAHVETSGLSGIVRVSVYERAYRIITAHNNYEGPNPQCMGGPGFDGHVGTYMNPMKIEPIGAPYRMADLQYALRPTGTWWKRVEVPYVTLPVRAV